jgi:hypothetical protein
VSDFGRCPTPLGDSDGYALWCELHACPYCDGVGEDYDGEGRHWRCKHCAGTGLEPGAGDGDTEDWP